MGEPVHEPAQYACSLTAASALLNSVSLGLAEWVTAVIVAYIWIGTSHETQPGVEILAVATHHVRYAVSADYCGQISLSMAAHSFREVMSAGSLPIPNLTNQFEVKEKGNILYSTVSMSSQKVMLVLNGRCVPTGVHLKCVALSDPTSECWHPKSKLSS